MTNTDHPEHALAQLGRGKHLSRRQFMGLLGAVAGGEIIASQLGPLRRVFGSGLAGGSADGVTVFIYLGGGNDGLNTVVPITQRQYDQYVAIRTKTISGITSSIAYPLPGTPGRADALLPGDSSIAFNPGLVNVSSWYRAGKVAVIQGVGYTNANFSHFESQEHWWSGTGPAGSAVSYKPPTGWLGRFADTLGLGPLGSISINGGGSLNPALRGLTIDPLAISTWGGRRIGDSTQNTDRRAAVAVHAMAAQTGLGTLANDWSNLGQRALDIAPSVGGAYTGIPSGASALKRQLTMAANLIGANLGTRIIHTDTGGFDTHENQRQANASGVEWHTGLWLDIDDSLNQFFSLLSAADRKRVNVVIYSEFGRRAEMNGTFGTDHGAASVAFVIGDNVKGGTYGEYPSLLDLRDPVSGGGGNLKSNVDFRQVYATLLQTWLGVDSAAVIGATHAQLGFIAAAPGDVVGAPTTTTTSTTSTTIAPTTTTSSTTTTLAPTTTTAAPSTTTTIPTTVTTIVGGVTTTTIVSPSTTIVTTTSSTPTTTIANPTTTVVTSTTMATPSTTVPATTTVPTTRPTTTTTMFTPTVVPPGPGSTRSDTTPDTPNTVTLTVVPPAPDPAPAARATTTTESPTTTAPSTTTPSTSITSTTRPTTTTQAPTTTRPTATSRPPTTVRGRTPPTTARRSSSTTPPPKKLALTTPTTKKKKARVTTTKKKRSR